MVATLELWNSARTPRPPLKWAGGKRWLVPHLMRLWMPHRARRLVEPLCRGLAVALGLSPARALLNDANAHVINFPHLLVPSRTCEVLHLARGSAADGTSIAGAQVQPCWHLCKAGHFAIYSLPS